MSKRTFAILILVLLVVAGIVFFARPKNDDAATPVLSVAAQNQTKNAPATNAPAVPGDILIYTLTAQNQSDKVISGYIMQANLSGVTDKAVLLEASGAQYNSGINSLVWTPLDIPAQGSIEKTFRVRVNPLAFGTTKTSLKITFNNELVVAVAAPPVVAGTDTTTPTATPPYKAPTTGASEALPLFLALFVTAAVIIGKTVRLKRI